MITENEWIPDSAGAGQYRSGPRCGVKLQRLPGYSLPALLPDSGGGPRIRAARRQARHDRRPALEQPAGAPDSEIARDGWVMFRTNGDELTFHRPSGAGLSDPRGRDRAAIETDIRRGLVTPEGAARDYAY